MFLPVVSTSGPLPYALKSHRSSVIALLSNPQIFVNGCHFPKNFLLSVNKCFFLFIFMCHYFLLPK